MLLSKVLTMEKKELLASRWRTKKYSLITMSLEAILFMIFVFVVCAGGFVYFLYLSSKNK